MEPSKVSQTFGQKLESIYNTIQIGDLLLVQYEDFLAKHHYGYSDYYLFVLDKFKVIDDNNRTAYMIKAFELTSNLVIDTDLGLDLERLEIVQTCENP